MLQIETKEFHNNECAEVRRKFKTCVNVLMSEAVARLKTFCEYCLKKWVHKKIY